MNPPAFSQFPMYSTNDVSLLPLPRLIACTDNIAENIAMPIGYTVNAVWFKYPGQVFTQKKGTECSSLGKCQKIGFSHNKLSGQTPPNHCKFGLLWLATSRI